MTTSHKEARYDITKHKWVVYAPCKGTEIILFYQTFAFFSISLPFFLKFFLFFPPPRTFLLLFCRTVSTAHPTCDKGQCNIGE